ncbi:hypothetical protein RFI_21109 [Reticulomyxa filosa]|uniref:Uncharacterized protein n=1 Tax=Reticulomyxa filosa TaxID=46433 RepID=X6MT11_RETFI|nr:hypothetical protein RFI_21109 [Reticulomyxa filosa]|eukprot:ETO16245.1 hypothetical protein RFI_21109 [Reticulomyxa filosa]
MKLSLVDEIILIILQVLTAVLAMSSVRSVIKENSNENVIIYSNNQSNMDTLMAASNDSVRQMWKCVQCQQGFSSVEISVQLKNISIRVIESTSMIIMRSKKNIHSKMRAMDIFTTSRMPSSYFTLKYSVCASIEVDVDVIVMINSQQSKVCKWFGHPGAQITFNKCFVIDCSSITMVRTPNLDINNIHNGDNSVFSTYRAPNNTNLQVQIQLARPSHCYQHAKICCIRQVSIPQITSQLSSKIFQVMFDISMLGRTMWRKKEMNDMDDKDHNDDLHMAKSATIIGADFNGNAIAIIWISTCIMW